MNEQGRVDILLIWVNAERQLERQLMSALESHAEFARPQIVEKDSHQAEISALFPSGPDILEAIIDSLLSLQGFAVSIQGAEKERMPTVVFRADPFSGRRKAQKHRTVRRHFDEDLTPPEAPRDSTAERVLSTSEMALTSGPRPGMQHRAGQIKESEARTADQGNRSPRASNTRRRANRPSKLVPLMKKVARIILYEEETPHAEAKPEEQ